MNSTKTTQINKYLEKVSSDEENQHETVILDNDHESCSVLLTPDHTPTKDGSLKDNNENEDVTENYKNKKPGIKLKIHCKELKVISLSDNTCKSGLAEDICRNPLTRSNSDSILDSPKPTKPKVVRSDLKEEISTEFKSVSRPPKPGRAAKSKRATKKQQSDNQANSSSSSNRNRSKSVPPKKKTESTNHLLTEYFPIRRSSRVPSSKLKKQQQTDLEEAILSRCEEGLEVIEFPGKGRGIVASKPFYKGDFVVEYAGDLIEINNAKQREEDYSSNSMIGCYMYYFNYQNKKYCIDATKESGKLGRLLNHSRLNNNCATRVVPINDTPYLIIVAARDIKVGEELLYDYGDRSKASLEAHPWLAL